MPRRSTLRLTKRTIDGLTVESKDTVFWDRDLAGFGVRVHATGRKNLCRPIPGTGRPQAGHPGLVRGRDDQAAQARGGRGHRPYQAGRGSDPAGART